MEIMVIKQNYTGREVWRYTGHLIKQRSDRILIEARFDRPDKAIQGLILEKGDRFVETYFSKRWYNIYKIYSHADGALKGWYCDICYPAVYQDGIIRYRDLALDLLVTPDGHQVVLDADEFQELDLPPKTRKIALEALTELKGIFARGFQSRPGV
jgi:predicted RNA-binding protein associated with RNAse of E/G family